MHNGLFEEVEVRVSSPKMTIAIIITFILKICLSNSSEGIYLANQPLYES